MPETDGHLPAHSDDSAGGPARAFPVDRSSPAEPASIYPQLVRETPQWRATLHAAVAAGEIDLTASALRDLKALALAHSGAGEGAWRVLHPLGDAALRARRLAPTVTNLVCFLRLMVHARAGTLPDMRLLDSLSSEGAGDERVLPARVLRLPAAVLLAIQRALGRQPADFGEADVQLRQDLRRVVDWTFARRDEATAAAARFGWARLVRLAAAWDERFPGSGVPPALPLRLRTRHLEATQLSTPAALVRESNRMHNCLDSARMAEELRRPDRAFFSIALRPSSRTVADLLVAYSPRARRWSVVQLKGPANGEVGPDVRAFARALCVSVSPRAGSSPARCLPAPVEHWALSHPAPDSARLAARFALMLARADPGWIAPYITRASRFRTAERIETDGDALLAGWSRQFTPAAVRARRRHDAPAVLRLLRLPSDPPGQPHCVFDDGHGARAIAFLADRDARLKLAAEVADRARIARWVAPPVATSTRDLPLPLPCA